MILKTSKYGMACNGFPEQKGGTKDMDLEEIRQEIDRVDGQMKNLFLKRMDLCGKVIETKKRTGAAVYAPKREQEILSARTEDVKEAYRLVCGAFFKQTMEISRAYQYAQTAKGSEKLTGLPQGSGRAEISFSCEDESGQPAVFLNAAALARLCVEEFTVKREKGRMLCGLCVTGDFSENLSKAAVLQILEECADAKAAFF